MYDGSISFSTALDNRQLEKELAGLTKKIEKKTQDIAKLTQKRDAVKGNGLFDGKTLDTEKAKLREMKDHLADIRARAKDKSLSSMQRDEAKALIPSLQEELADQRTRVSGLQTEWNKLQNAAERYDAQIAEATAELEKQKQTAGQLLEKLNQDSGAGAQERMGAYLKKNSALYQQLSGALGKTADASAILQGLAAATGGGKLSGAFQTAGEAVSRFGISLSGAAAKAAPFLALATAIFGILKQLWKAAVEFSAGFANALKRGAAAVYDFSSAVARNFVAALKTIGKLSASFAKMVTGITKSVMQFSKRINAFSRMAETLGGVFKRLGNTIKSALVFSVIYKGLSLLKEQVSSYLMVNEQFSTALRRLQGVLLTAFQPIYDVIVPALTTLINALTNAIAVIAQFFASLFGTTAKKAQVNAKALYGQANALEATGEAAEKAAGSLAGFDEINTIQTEDKSGGGGSGASAGTGPLFDYDYEETPFDTWGEAFSAFLDRLLEGIPKLEDAFGKFADWLNDLSKKLYDMFTFPGVLDKVKALGRDLADALNNLVNNINWEQAGQALGAGLNLALNFLTELIYGFDWINLGRKLAEFVNGMVAEIDWYEFGRLLWAGFKIGLETLAGFLVGLDMPLLAEAASSIVKGFFDEMYNTVTRIPWMAIGTQIATFLNGIDWYGTITSALTAIQAAIIGLAGMVLRFIEGLKWGSIAQQIYTAINDSLGQVEWSGIGYVIGQAFVHVFDFVRDVVSGIKWGEIGQNIADLILGFDFASALGSLADLIAAGINAAIQLARGLLDTIMPEVQGIVGDIASRLKEAVSSVEWGELGGVIGDGIKTALTFVAGLLDPDLFYEVGKAIGDFLVGLDWVGIVGGLTEVLANAISSAVAAVGGFLDSVQPNLQEIAEGIAQKINEFVEKVDWAELGQTIHDGIDAALDFLITILDNLNWDEIGQAVVDFLANLNWGTLLNKWGTVVGKAVGGALKGIDLTEAAGLGVSIVGGMLGGMLNKWNESGGILGWIKRKLFSPFVEGFCSLFGIHSPSTVMAEQGGYLIEGLEKGITDAWKSIADFFPKKLTELKKSFSDAWKSIQETAAKTWNDIKTSLTATWNNIQTTASTAFEAVKNKITSAWDKAKSDTSQKWNTIKTNLNTTWNNVKTTASTTFEAIKEKITSAWDKANSDTSQKWNSIQSTLSGAWDSIQSTAVSKFEGIKSSITGVWSGLVSSASSWGRDICSNIASGISSAIGTVTSAVSSVAGKISSFLHFSEPDAGPLSNFHTFMPDMLELMARGIRDNTALAVNAASDLAGSVANTLGGKSIGVNVSAMPDFSNYTIPNIAMGAVLPTNREFLSVLVDRDAEDVLPPGQEAGDGEIIALLQAILTAVKAGKVMVVDEGVLARTAQKGLDDITTKTGKFALKF